MLFTIFSNLYQLFQEKRNQNYLMFQQRNQQVSYIVGGKRLAVLQHSLQLHETEHRLMNSLPWRCAQSNSPLVQRHIYAVSVLIVHWYKDIYIICCFSTYSPLAQRHIYAVSVLIVHWYKDIYMLFQYLYGKFHFLVHVHISKKYFFQPTHASLLIVNVSLIHVQVL